MKPIRPILFAFTCAAIVASAPVAHAQLNLAWNNCITQGNSAVDKAYACDGSLNGSAFKGVMSFVSPVSINNFVGIQAVVDMGTTTGDPLPDFWRLGVGECRDGNFIFPSSLTGIGTGTTGVCRNPWVGANTGGGFQWYTESNGQFAVPGGARVKIAFARDTETSLTQNQQYIAGVFLLDSFNDVDTGSGLCAGCVVPACLVLNQIELYQTVGSPGGDIIVMSTEATRRYITWQGGAIGGPGCPASVPVRKATWGSVKSLYR